MHAHNRFGSPITGLDQIRVEGVTRSFGGRLVLNDVCLTVGPRERLGVLGENGAGKSTLLRIVAGEEQPDSGQVHLPARARLLAQEVRFNSSTTAGDLIERALDDARNVERELEASAAACAAGEEAEARYSAALEAATQVGLWNLDVRRAKVLAGLGLTGIPLDRPIHLLSGGQRSRFALAGLLLAQPTALLLDEPTNHLDDEATEFLRNELLNWPGPVMFASHDRALLDEVATATVDLDPSRAGVQRFGGGFSHYLHEKAEERRRWQEQYEREQGELERLRTAVAVTSRTIAPGRGPRDNDKFVHKFRGAKHDQAVARRVRDARGRFEELETRQVRKPRPPLSFAGIPRERASLSDAEPLVCLREAALPGRLAATSLDISARTALLLTGVNGAGKSTLLMMLAGALQPVSGRLVRRPSLRLSLLQQDVHLPEADRSARALYEQAVGEARASQVPLSSLGLIAPRDLDRPVGVLSVGQQRRLALALIIARPPHLFLLDEPTNHLSLSLAVELEDALGTYPGAVVIASHDRWLRRRWTGERLHLEPAF